MLDIFISYSSEDRLRVEPLAKAFENRGWSVWWDWKTIPIGKTWRQFVEEGLKTSKCILVIWSKYSILSEWVIEEADVGKERKIIVPVIIDDVIPPIGFRQIQAARLLDWKEDPKHTGFEHLLIALQNIIERQKPKEEKDSGEKGQKPFPDIILSTPILTPGFKIHGLNFLPIQAPNLMTSIQATASQGRFERNFDYQPIQEQNAVTRYEQIERCLKIIAPYTHWLRTHSVHWGSENANRIVHSLQLKAAVGAAIDKNTPQNEIEMEVLVYEAKRGNVDIAIIGNEVLSRKFIKREELISYIHQFRKKAPNVPVTTADYYVELLSQPQILNECDIVMANFHPYWEGVKVKDAISWIDSRYKRLRALANGKEIIISETGWPSSGNNVNAAVASPENAAFFFTNFVSWAHSLGIKYFYYEAFDSPWKAAFEGEHGGHWGVLDKGGKIKPGMQQIFDNGPGCICPICKMANEKGMSICKWCKSAIIKK
jgi:exo-beta-1,3-glucanase (GH17 family)